MIIFSKTTNKSNFLFSKLPNYFEDNDTYVGNGVEGYSDDGILERFLESLCLELDNEFSPYVDSLGFLFDATGLNNIPGTNKDRFLVHIADDWGNPPSIGNTNNYSVLLRYLIYILRRKGTLESINLYIRLFGYKVKSVSSTPYDTIKYDENAKYDTGKSYDIKSMFYHDLSIIITDYNGFGPNEPTEQWLGSLKQALIQFIIPIYTNLVSVTYQTN